MHPKTLEARRAYIDAYMRLNLAPALTKLVANGTRLRVTMLAIALHGAADPNDPSTSATLAHLTEEVEARGLGSPNFVQSLVARLVDRCFLHAQPSPLDRRQKLLIPTDVLMERMLDLVEARAAPASILDPRDIFAPAFARDRVYAIAYLVASQLPRDEVKRQCDLHPEMMRLIFRDNGVMILIVLLQDAMKSLDETTATIGQRGIAEVLGVSRTHVRELLDDLETQGFIARQGASIVIQPSLWQVFDAFVVETSMRFAHFYAEAHAVVAKRRPR